MPPVAPDHLLVVHLSPGRAFEAFYNGPYAIVWEHMRWRRKAAANNVRHVRVNMLLELDATVDERDRLKAINEPPVL